MNNGFENLDNMNEMRQNAIKRAQEMNSRAMPILPEPANNEQQHLESKTKNHEHQSEKHEHQSEEHTSQKNFHSNENQKKTVKDKNINLSILDTLFEDPEKSLILILIFIFLDEDTNPMLIMALMYLLM